jgi:glyoxylase-like metal-dependent hydrolase (beta-lactamase superfamily II)
MENKLVLVDTSMRFELAALIRSMQKIGVRKIDAIFLTHSHTDHVANAQYFSNAYNCKIYISEKGLEKIQKGRCSMPKGTTPFGKLIYWTVEKNPFYEFVNFQACPQAEILNDMVVKAYLGDSAELLLTPGHTDDSISILLDKRIAIVGDAMVNNFGNQYPSFADDEEAVKASWKALLDTRCELFCPAHGNPLKREELLFAYRKICAL